MRRTILWLAAAAAAIIAAVIVFWITGSSDQNPEQIVSKSEISLSLPIDCTPGRDCWIQNYVDVDPGPGRADYHCGSMSYDKHKGTDFALRDEGRIAEGVPVLAVAPGKIVGTRNAMPDVNIRKTGRASVKGKECGNGVRIDHGNGWSTQYCHMKQGSIQVKTDQTVQTGQRIGSVGLSGMTEFPHIHLSVEKDGKPVDPFRGLDGGEKCGTGLKPLWTETALQKLDYSAPLIFNAGFSTKKPTEAEMSEGKLTATVFSSDAPLLILWLQIAGVRAGDELEMTLSAPDGSTLVTNKVDIEKTKIRSWYFIGKRRPQDGWPKGIYKATLRSKRADGGNLPASHSEIDLEMTIN